MDDQEGEPPMVLFRLDSLSSGRAGVTSRVTRQSSKAPALLGIETWGDVPSLAKSGARSLSQRHPRPLT